jgi:poly(glycerol-phosphate) alpha-glucosyltransferase
MSAEAAATGADVSRLTLHLPLNTLAVRRGGLVTAVLRRANLLAASRRFAGVWVEVLGLQPRLAQDGEVLRREGRLHPLVSVRSVLGALDPSAAPGAPVVPDSPGSPAEPLSAAEVLARLLPGSEDLERLHDRLDPAVTWWLRDGLPLARVTSAAASTPTSDPTVPTKVELLDPVGRVTRVADIDASGRATHLLDRAEEGAAATHRFLGDDGRCYLTVRQSRDGTWRDPLLRDAEGVLRPLPGMGEVYRQALERALAPEKRPVLFSEFRENLPNLPDRTLDDVVKAVRHPSLRTVAVGHSNHRRTPFDAGAGATPNWHRLLRGLGCWDALVLLTAAQRDDVLAELAASHPPADRVAVIPQMIGPVDESSSDEPDPDRVVLVARLHPKKRVTEAVRAFRHVVDARPSARLHVYGFGYGDDYERGLRELVTSLRLDGSVVFEGFMPMTGGATPYDGACVTWLTSASEGFPLSLLESMARGVPVLSFDTPYGPSEVIEDGSNGVLVPVGDVEALAARTVAVMGDPHLRARLSRAARASVARFSPDRHAATWVELLGSLGGPPATRATLAPDFEVESATWDDDLLRLGVGVPRDAVSAQLVVRVRDGEQVAVQAVRHGWVEIDLPSLRVGTIFDLSLRADVVDWDVRDASVTQVREHRLVLPDIELPGHPRWRIYRTAHGSFSVKATAPTSGPRPEHRSLPRRVVRALARRL